MTERINNCISPQFPNLSMSSVIFDFSSSEKLRPTPNYQFETQRLNSFKNWRYELITPKQLAAAGFYYTGENNVVKCFSCQVEVREWTTYDPMFEHRQLSENCKFVRNVPCGNVPHYENSAKIPPSFTSEGYEYRMFDCEQLSRERMRSRITNYFENKQKEEIEEIDSTIRNTRPKYPEYANYDARLHTYKTCHDVSQHIKQKLAAAGLFFTRRYLTICYYCGGVFTDWKFEWGPEYYWEEHVRKFELCPYLHIVKGTNYVNNVLKKDMLNRTLPRYNYVDDPVEC